MDDVALVIGLVASTATTILALGTLMKWLLDAKIDGVRSELGSRIDGLDRRLTNVENDLHVIKQHLIGASAPWAAPS